MLTQSISVSCPAVKPEGDQELGRGKGTKMEGVKGNLQDGGWCIGTEVEGICWDRGHYGREERDQTEKGRQKCGT